jgi:hypothetical protein
VKYDNGKMNKVVRCAMIAGPAGCAVSMAAQQPGLAVSVDARGRYSIGSSAVGSPVLASGCEGLPSKELDLSSNLRLQP